MVLSIYLKFPEKFLEIPLYDFEAISPTSNSYGQSI